MEADDKFDLNGSSDIHIKSNTQKFVNRQSGTNEDSLQISEIKYSSKHKILVNSISNSVNNFIDDFNFLFYDQIFQKFFREISQINEEKYRKCFEIGQKYNSQISEMEMMMRDDDGHMESLKVIVDNLSEERDSEINESNKLYDQMIEEKRMHFKESNLTSAPALQTIKEKFKIDMLNTVNDVIYPKK